MININASEQQEVNYQEFKLESLINYYLTCDW